MKILHDNVPDSVDNVKRTADLVQQAPDVIADGTSRPTDTASSVAEASASLCVSPTLPSNTKTANVSSVTVPRQRDRRAMSRRRGQKGSVRVVGQKYVGRFWADMPAALRGSGKQWKSDTWTR
jgi:hypothetical protein